MEDADLGLRPMIACGVAAFEEQVTRLLREMFPAAPELEWKWAPGMTLEDKAATIGRASIENEA